MSCSLLSFVIAHRHRLTHPVTCSCIVSDSSHLIFSSLCFSSFHLHLIISCLCSHCISVTHLSRSCTDTDQRHGMMTCCGFCLRTGCPCYVIDMMNTPSLCWGMGCVDRQVGKGSLLLSLATCRLEDVGTVECFTVTCGEILMMLMRMLMMMLLLLLMLMM